MDKKQISQKEYLKKYLSSGKDKKKVKKKKPNLGAKTVKIIDDDIDLKNMRAIEDGEFDIYAGTEDGPQIAGIVDERGPVDFSDKRRWKIITDDGYGDISVTSVARSEKIPQESNPRIEAASNPSKKRSSSPDSDCSPPRRSGKNSESEEPQRKKSSSKKKRKSTSGSEDSDPSPPRKSKKNSDSEEPRRKKSKSKKKRRAASSPAENNSASENSDLSPPRRPGKNSDADEQCGKNSPSKKRRRSASGAGKNRSGTEDSDFSPPRRPRKDSESDLSPPRNPKGRDKGEHRSRDEYSSNSRKKLNNKYDKERENSSRDSRRRNNDKNSRNRSPRSDSHRTGKHGNGNSHSEHKGNRRSREDHSGKGAARREKETSPLNRRKNDNSERRNTNLHSRKGGNNSDSDLSPPRESKRKSRDVEAETSPRENKKKFKNLEPESSVPQKTPFKNYQEMSAETSGFGQAPVLRDRKTGRRRDLAAEAREQEEKDGKRQELEEKYAQWGRGLKQVEDRQEKLDRDLYEMSKPLARYADDADLERELKAQEREGDPMLAYMKRKHKKEGKHEPEKPKYNGPSMPNRFGIRPGYRWDGVDRSNGYEKKWFDAQNARKAVQEEAYKWSTADM